MKAEKRVRYGQKERDRLEKMLASYDKEEKERQEQKEKELMEHEPQVLGEELFQKCITIIGHRFFKCFRCHGGEDRGKGKGRHGHELVETSSKAQLKVS